MVSYPERKSVLLPRVHGFEFNDQAWIPLSMREILTYAIGKGFVESGAGSLMGQILASKVEECGATSILELAAGSAAPSVELAKELVARGVAVNYVVTDKYPDIEAFRRVSEITEGRITYIEQPVDALNPPGNLRGLRMLVTSFHHFRPEQALRILRGAHENGLPIAIFEFTDRGLVRTLTSGPFSLLFMLVILPRILKRYSWRGALWFIPAAIALAWDGFVSCLRSYTLCELASMTQTLGGYNWRYEIIKTKTPSIRLTYLTGAAAPISALSADQIQTAAELA